MSRLETSRGAPRHPAGGSGGVSETGSGGPRSPADSSQGGSPKPAAADDAGSESLEDTSYSTSAVNQMLMEVLLYFGRAFVFLFPVYLTGYLGLSISWVLLCLMLWTWWRRNRKVKSTRLDTAIDFLENERFVINEEMKALNMPAWVNFPDVERADWLNKVLQQAWPFFGIYMEKLLKEKIQPSIRASSPHLKTFTFTKVHFGQKPLRVTGVKAYTEEVDKRQVILDLNLSYAGDVDIDAEVKKPITAGVKGIQLTGLLRVILEPLTGQSPLVGGVTIFFIRRPQLDINWTGLTNLLDSPALNNISEDAILNIISSFMVLPNRMCFPLIDQVQVAQMRFPLPRGVVRVHLIEAQDLMAKDTYMLGMVKGKSDPYAKLRVGTQAFKSKTIKENLDPRWGEVYEFVVHEAPGQELEVELYDEDTDRDDFLGRMKLDLGDVMKERLLDEWFELEEAETGKLHLRLEWLSLVTDLEKLEETREGRACAMLAVYLDSASSLPRNLTEYSGTDYGGKHNKQAKQSKVTRKNDNPSSYAELTVEQQTQKSNTIHATKDPVWEECFTFFVHHIQNQSLIVQIKGSDKKVPLGVLALPLGRLLTATDMTLDQRFQLERSGVNSFLKMKATLRFLAHEKPQPKKVDPKLNARARGPAKGANKPSSPLPSPSEPLPSPDREVRSPLGGESGRKAPSLRPNGQSEGKPTAPATPFVRDVSSVHRYDSSSMLSSYSVASSRYDLTEGGGSYPEAILSHQGGFGEIQLSVRYAALRKQLLVLVNCCRNLVSCGDQGSDPYVRIYLLPDRKWKHRKRTLVKKKTSDPVFEEKFEFSVSLEEAKTRQLDVAVKNNRTYKKRDRKEIGMVLIDLSQDDLRKGFTNWYELSLPGVQK
uniref:Extended synaptotagmin-3 n=1 Tax=Lepisosteus oculatus TaxID=7918 RepID=W5M6F5_LEPOC|nr:PREDICTED: extended synaptotagmin-3 isoform X1 [Lepisosteus oculatus]